MKTERRIGLFGGTFNPVHRGHLVAIQEVRDAFSLDTVYFIPSALPPHKPVSNLADAAHRMEMLRRALSGVPGVAVSDIELKRPGPSYSVDTVTRFRERFPRGTGLYFILGVDAFLEIDTWKSHESLFEMIPFVVMSRPDGGAAGIEDPLAAVARFVRRCISGDYRVAAGENRLVHPARRPIFIQPVSPVDISSTRIRERIRGGLSVRELVPEPVEIYINEQGLYR